MNLKHLTDTTLLYDTKFLAQQYRHVTRKLLHHIREIEKRRLFSDLGYPTLFEYVVKELGFSEPSAARRINASRLLEDLPEIEAKIENGSLNLTNICLAAQTLKNENIKDPKIKKEVLKSIENTSKRECERRLQQLITPKTENTSTIISINISDNTVKLLNDLKGILAHKKLGQDEFFATVFKTAYEQFLKMRFKTESNKETTTKNPRYITAKLKKEIFTRDQVCQKCGGNYALEIDHKEPFALGGKTEAKNLRLLCRSCNQRARIKAGL